MLTLVDMVANIVGSGELCNKGEGNVPFETYKGRGVEYNFSFLTGQTT